MSTKISGTDGIDVAQLRAPDGDPVAMTIDALGKLAFPAQGQLLAGDGYIKFPGGLIIQWGSRDVDFNNATVTEQVVVYPTPFTAVPFSQVISRDEGIAAGANSQVVFTKVSNTSGKIFASNVTAGQTVPGAIYKCSWIAIGY